MGFIDQIQFREAAKKDIARLVEIERASFSDYWKEDAFHTCLIGPFYDMNVALIDENIVGYTIMKCMYEDGELIRIAVDSRFRSLGIGYRILTEAIERASDLGVRKIFLDVRESNKSAISMYDKLGFIPYDVTRDFYRDPKEDSIKYRKDIV